MNLRQISDILEDEDSRLEGELPDSETYNFFFQVMSDCFLSFELGVAIRELLDEL
jgi:hypothetical protein